MHFLSPLCVSENVICYHDLLYGFKITVMSLSMFLPHDFECSSRFIRDYDYTKFDSLLVTQYLY